MKAIILAAGRGSRMKELTDERPKCLVELRGQPLLQWQLAALREAGIRDIALVTGYQREKLAPMGLTEFYNPRWTETNMVYSLACANEWLQSEPCIVSYSDIFYGPQAVKSLMECPASLAIAYDPEWLPLWTRRFGDPLLDAETFRLNSDGSLAEIGQKPTSVQEIEGQYMGLLRIAPEGWKEIEHIRAQSAPSERDKMDMTSTLNKVIAAHNTPIAAIPYRGEWGEVDSSRDLAVYHSTPPGSSNA